MPRLGIVQHPIYQEHDPGPYHPESAERLAAIERVLASQARGLFEALEPRPASREELAWVHSPAYIDRVAATAGRSYDMLDGDTHTSARSYEAALMAAGGMLSLVEAVNSGRIEAGFALVRPPGHHAERGQGRGFCLFNNIAVAACFALNKLGLERVLIADWDLHHGNGTQHSFEAENRVLYFSTHQSPFYPGTGQVDEVGHGRGEGYTVNVPISSGHGDAEYVQMYSRLLKPLALEYRPQLILVSAGFDIYQGDLLGSQLVSPAGFAALARLTAELAADLCPGRLVLTLEGGYNVEGEAESVLAVVRQLSQGLLADQEVRDDPARQDIPAVAATKRIHSAYWKCFRE